MSVRDNVSQAMDFLRTRKMAYQLTFNVVRKPKISWREGLALLLRALGVGQPAPTEVLIDLARFCRANETCVVPGDPIKTAVLEGRREVFLRIQQHLNLTPEQLFSLYSGNAPKQKEVTQ